MKIYSRIVACVGLLILLFGCATTTRPTSDTESYQIKPWKARKLTLTGHRNWNMQGAVSIQIQNKTQMGTFAWQQHQAHYAIQIYGPLNLASIALQGGPQYVSLWKSGHKYFAPTPEALMQQQLGWYLPISNLYYWVRGLPAPNTKCQEDHDRFGHLVNLDQEGWNIQYKNFSTYDGVDLPRKVYLSNQNIRVKLVINDWNLY